MLDKPLITSSHFRYDMGPWLIEKTARVVKSLSENLDLAKMSSNLQLENQIRAVLNDTLHDLTKILSFASGGDWSPNDQELILSHGVTGYERIAIKYGIIDESYVTNDKRFEIFTTKFQEYISGDVSSNRTLIHELLVECNLKHKIIDRISMLIDDVSMGNRKWIDFTAEASELLKELLAKRDEIQF